MSRYKDFDAAIAERKRREKREPLSFTLGGKKFELPDELPAIIPLTAARLKRDYGNDADIPESELISLATALFGSQLDAILATGVSTPDLGELIQWTIEEYTTPDKGADEGNATAPAAATIKTLT
jgi:hypothetical protein